MGAASILYEPGSSTFYMLEALTVQTVEVLTPDQDLDIDSCYFWKAHGAVGGPDVRA